MRKPCEEWNLDQHNYVGKIHVEFRGKAILMLFL